MSKRVAARRSMKKREDLMYLVTAIMIAAAVASISYFNSTAFVTFSPTASAAAWPSERGPLGSGATADTGPSSTDVTEVWSVDLKQQLTSEPVISADGLIAVTGTDRIYVINKDGTHHTTLGVGENPYTNEYYGLVPAGVAPFWQRPNVLAYFTRNVIWRDEIEPDLSSTSLSEKPGLFEATASLTKGIIPGGYLTFYGEGMFVGTDNGFVITDYEGNKLHTILKTGITATPVIAHRSQPIACQALYDSMKDSCTKGKIDACSRASDFWMQCLTLLPQTTTLAPPCMQLLVSEYDESGNMKKQSAFDGCKSGLQAGKCKDFFTKWETSSSCKSFSDAVAAKTVDTGEDIAVFAAADQNIYALGFGDHTLKVVDTWEDCTGKFKSCKIARLGQTLKGTDGKDFNANSCPSYSEDTVRDGVGWDKCGNDKSGVPVFCLGKLKYQEGQDYLSCRGQPYPSSFMTLSAVTAPLAAVGDTFYAGTEGGDLYKITLGLDDKGGITMTGTGGAMKSGDGAIKAAPAADAKGRVAFGTTKGTVYIYTSDKKWAEKNIGGSVTAVVIGGDTVYAGNDKGNVSAFKLADGSGIWNRSFDGGIAGMSISGERLYVTAGSKLVVLEGDATPPKLLQTEPKGSTFETGVDKQTNYWSSFTACALATDDKNLKSITLEPDKGSDGKYLLDCSYDGKQQTYTAEVSGTGARACFECRPLAAGKAGWKFTAEDAAGNIVKGNANTVSTSGDFLPADTEAPKCTIELGSNAANAFEMPPYGGAYVKATCTDNNGFGGGLKEMNITIQKKGGEEKLLTGEKPLDKNLWDMEYSCVAPDCTDGTERSDYTVRVRAIDNAGNAAAETAGLLKVVDITPPTITEAKASNEKPSPGDTVTLSVTASDSGGFGTAYFVVSTEKESIAVPITGQTASTDYKVTAAEGQTITWHVTVSDASGNTAESDEMSFTVADVTPPSLSVNSVTLKNSIMRGQTLTIDYEASDAVALDRIELKINGASNTNRTAYGKDVTNLFSIGPSWYEANVKSYPAKAAWSITAYDKAGHSNVTDGTFIIDAPCLQTDKSPPTIANEQMSGEPLPGETVNFTASLTEVGPAKCGNLSDAHLELNYTGSPFAVQTINFRPTAKSATAAFNWNVPDTDTGSGQFVAVTITAISIRPLMGIGRPEIPEIPFMPMLPVSKSKRVALPGSTIAWRITANDLAGNAANTAVHTFIVKDNEAPVIVNTTGPEKITTGSNATFTACAYDWNVKPAKLALEVDDGSGKFVQVAEKQLATDSKETGCADFTWGDPMLPFGTSVSWRIIATDAADNMLAGDINTLKIISNPPTFTDASAPSIVKKGATITLSKKWTDDNGLTDASLLIDTGSGFKEAGTVQLTGKTGVSTFHYKVGLDAGKTFKWSITATDMDGSTNSSDPEILVEEDTMPPTWTNMAQSADSVQEGGRLLLTVQLSDDTELTYATLQTDEGGDFSDVKTVIMSGANATASFEWFNPLTTAGKTVEWRVTATDVNGNKVTTSSMGFAVTAAAKPSCPETCVGTTGWTACTQTDGKWTQRRTNFKCGADTNYECKTADETQACTPPSTIEPLPIAILILVALGGGLFYANKKGMLKQFAPKKKAKPKEEDAETL
jgi:hypothetical protein